MDGVTFTLARRAWKRGFFQVSRSLQPGLRVQGLNVRALSSLTPDATPGSVLKMRSSEDAQEASMALQARPAVRDSPTIKSHAAVPVPPSHQNRLVPRDDHLRGRSFLGLGFRVFGLGFAFLFSLSRHHEHLRCVACNPTRTGRNRTLSISK